MDTPTGTEKQESEEPKAEETLSPEASKETETVSEEKPEQEPEKKEEAKPISFESEEAFEQAIKDKVDRAAQGRTDKQLKSVYDQLNQLKRDKEEAELKVSDKTEDSKLSKLEKAELDELGDTPEVRSIQDARREVVEKGRDMRRRERDLAEREQKVTTNADQQNVFTDVLKFLLVKEDADTLFAAAQPLIDKLVKAKTPEERKLILEVEELKRQRGPEQPKEKEKRTKPDSSLPTASGGVDISRLSPDEKISLGLKEKRKTQK